jgi:hypothetical protein
MDKLFEALQMLVVFATIAFIVKIALEYGTRKKLIDKGLVDENVRHLFNYAAPAASSLKWGMVLTGIGIAVLIGRLVPYRWEEEMTISLMFILAGLALIIYYVIAPKLRNRSNGGKQ